MKTSPNLKNRYPKLNKWLWRNIKLVKNKPKVTNAMMQASGMTREQVNHVLSGGTNPVIDSKYHPRSLAFFRNSEPLFVNLSTRLCDRFENIDHGSPQMHQFMEVTVLHEMVHYGFYHTGKSHAIQGVEEGWQFEKLAYGKIFLRYW